MADFEFAFDKLSTNVQSSIAPGVHRLTIDEAEQVVASTGTLMLQCTYHVDDTKTQIRFDNYALVNASGEPISFGQNKLKAMMKAVNVSPAKFTLKTLIPLIKGKTFEAEIVQNEKGYWSLGNINSIKPVSTTSNPSMPSPEPTVEKVLVDTSIIGEEEVDLGW